MDDMQVLEDEVEKEHQNIAADDIDLAWPMRINWLFPLRTFQISEGKRRNDHRIHSQAFDQLKPSIDSYVSKKSYIVPPWRQN